MPVSLWSYKTELMYVQRIQLVKRWAEQLRISVMKTKLNIVDYQLGTNLILQVAPENLSSGN